MKLLTEISEQFDIDENAADLSILYEVTGYQAESQNFSYWENYADFEELGETKLTRDDKNEQLIAHSSRSSAQKSINFDDAT